MGRNRNGGKLSGSSSQLSQHQRETSDAIRRARTAATYRGTSHLRPTAMGERRRLALRQLLQQSNSSVSSLLQASRTAEAAAAPAVAKRPLPSSAAFADAAAKFVGIADADTTLAAHCCRQMGLDWNLYTSAALDDGDDDGICLLHMLPSDVLERLAVEASRHGNVTDDNLPMLCSGTVASLVVHGRYAAVDALWPRRASEEGAAPATWEGESRVPRFAGCVRLRSLALRSPRLRSTALLTIATELGAALEKLSVAGCFANEEAEVVAVNFVRAARELTGLAVVDCRFCAWFDRQCADELLDVRPGVRVLSGRSLGLRGSQEVAL